MPSFRIGVDVGGTFTDFLLVDQKGRFEVFKVLSTPETPSQGLLNGLEEMAQSHGNSLPRFLADVELIVHGTTITTNTLLTGSGAKTGLLTTKGFRDILQMRRGYKEETYNSDVTAPLALVARYLIYPVDERVNYGGEVITAVKEEVMAGLNPVEIERSCALIEEIRNRGITVLIVEHIMKVIMSIAGRIVVLNYGRKIAEGTPKEISQNAEALTAYLGEDFGSEDTSTP